MRLDEIEALSRRAAAEFGLEQSNRLPPTADEIAIAKRHDRWHVACHEAGHCIAAETLGVSLVAASILPDEKGSGGRVRCSGARSTWHRLIFLLAGGAAESTALGTYYSASGNAADIEHARDILATARLPLDLNIDAALAEAQKLVQENWLAVECLAAELIRDNYLESFALDAAVRRAFSRKEN